MSDAKITVDVDDAVRVLLDGGIIGMPTETVYGLAAIATNESAVSRVFAVKGRPTSHPLILHLSPTSDWRQWGVFNEHAEQLAQRCWPGPLTLLVPKTDKVPYWVTGGRDTVAIRVPAHPVAIDLLTKLGTAVVAPSANLFGRVSPTTAAHVAHDLADSVDLVLDGGQCGVGVESTIVECIGGVVSILRPGAFSREDIEAILHTDVGGVQGDSRAPGMMASHYAPRARVRLFATLADAQAESAQLTENSVSHVVMYFDNAYEYAEQLYSSMREADAQSCVFILAVLPDRNGMGDAVRDRLYKAAAES